jgi:hypothetical protein
MTDSNPKTSPKPKRVAQSRPTQPLAEVFGFPANNHGTDATRYRTNRLCPFHNKSPNCTKDKAADPLGVCSIAYKNGTAITCPVRFRQEWMIAEHAARFFFGERRPWTSIAEVQMLDIHGDEVGSIDLVMVLYDDQGRIVDFGSVEVQGVYISGNIRRAFKTYMEDPADRAVSMNWAGEKDYPRPDFLSSRKRLAPQVAGKGGILNGWRKRQAIVIDRAFFEVLPPLQEVTEAEAEVVWLVYDLALRMPQNMFELSLVREIYTPFAATSALMNSAPVAPRLEEFVRQLQKRLDKELPGNRRPGKTTLADVLDPQGPPVDPDQV